MLILKHRRCSEDVDEVVAAWLIPGQGTGLSACLQ